MKRSKRDDELDAITKHPDLEDMKKLRPDIGVADVIVTETNVEQGIWITGNDEIAFRRLEVDDENAIWWRRLIVLDFKPSS